MKKRITLWLLVTLFLVNVSLADAQQTGKVFRIGFLDNSTASGVAVFLEAFRQELRKLGWIEGKNIAIEYRFAEGKSERLPELAAEMVRLKVDIVVVAGEDASVQAAMKATKTIPIVMTSAGLDPFDPRLVVSPARPGNLTGITLRGVDLGLGGKRVELFKEAVPKVADVLALYDPGFLGSLDEVVVARALGLIFRSREVADADDFEKVFAALNTHRPGPNGLYVTGGPLMLTNEKRIAGFALKSRLPSMYNRREFVDAGGLMSYGPNYPDLWRRAATYVDKILRGTKPADLPVEAPTKFEFIINLKAAKQIGLTIPPNVLVRADKVIK
jgi:putative tryptophan/tyrosine transport system substrate-binding protein